MDGKHCLIKFDDGIFHVCNRNYIKITDNKQVMARWGKTYYPTKILYSSNDFHQIISLWHNIVQNYPKVEITKYSEKKISIISDIQLNNVETSDVEPYSSDDSIKDPTYELESDYIDENFSENQEHKLNIASKEQNIFSTISPKYDQHYYAGNLNIKVVEPSHCLKSKKYFCMFCHKLVTKFARHIETVHNTVKEVERILLLPKGEFLT